MKNKRFISLVAAFSMIIALFTGLTIVYAAEKDGATGQIAGTTWYYTVTETTIAIKPNKKGAATVTLNGITLTWAFGTPDYQTVSGLTPDTMYTVEITRSGQSGSFDIRTLSGLEPEEPVVALTGEAKAEVSGTFWLRAEYQPKGEKIESTILVVEGANKKKTINLHFGENAEINGTVKFLLGVENAPAGDYTGTTTIKTTGGTATSDVVTVTVE